MLIQALVNEDSKVLAKQEQDSYSSEYLVAYESYDMIDTAQTYTPVFLYLI